MSKDRQVWKIVREKVPDIIMKDNPEPATKVVDDITERLQLLCNRISLENNSIKKNKNISDVTTSIAEIVELLGTVVDLLDIEPDKIFKEQERLKTEAGCYNKFIAIKK